MKSKENSPQVSEIQFLDKKIKAKESQLKKQLFKPEIFRNFGVTEPDTIKNGIP